MIQSIQPACYGVISVFFVLSTITILLRIYSRGFILKNFGWDDWCISAILFFNTGHQFILYYFLHYGGGLHITTLMEKHPEWVTNLTYGLFVEEIYYVWMHWIIKTAFLLFYLRFAKGIFRTLTYSVIGLNTTFTIIEWLIYCLQCVPLGAFFHKAEHPGVKCLSNTVQAFVPAAFTIFIDICILLLPILPLWRIQVSVQKRVELVSLVSLGGAVVIISILRLTVLLQFQRMTDFPYSLGKIIIISSVELEVAIMVANAPSLRIFWVKGRGSRPQSRLSGRTPKALFRLLGLSTAQSKFNSHTDASSNAKLRSSTKASSVVEGSGRWKDDSMGLNESEKCGAKKEFETRIIVTSSVGIESEERQKEKLTSRGGVTVHCHSDPSYSNQV